MLEKQQGLEAFRAGKYTDAIAKLETAWNKQHDPETLIYLNNARINLKGGNKIRTLAIVVSHEFHSQQQSCEETRFPTSRCVSHDPVPLQQAIAPNP